MNWYGIARWISTRDMVWGCVVSAILLGWWLDRAALIREREMYLWRFEVLLERYNVARDGAKPEERGFVLDPERSRLPFYRVYWK
jgi:hypothetical protein